MGTYELTLIVKPALTSDQVDAMVKMDGVEITNTQQWGKRLFAYPIRDLKEGQYVFFEIKAEQKMVQKLVQHVRQNESVLRHLFIHVDTKN